MSEVRARREALGFSRRDVVDRSKGLLTHANVYTIEQGREPSPDEAAGLSIALGLGARSQRTNTRDPAIESARPPHEEYGVDAPQVEKLDPALDWVPDFEQGDPVFLYDTDTDRGFLRVGDTGVVTDQADTSYGRIVDVHWDGADAPFPALLHAGDVLSFDPTSDG